jgi:hypothetical protein
MVPSSGVIGRELLQGRIPDRAERRDELVARDAVSAGLRRLRRRGQHVLVVGSDSVHNIAAVQGNREVVWWLGPDLEVLVPFAFVHCSVALVGQVRVDPRRRDITRQTGGLHQLERDRMVGVGDKDAPARAERRDLAAALLSVDQEQRVRPVHPPRAVRAPPVIERAAEGGHLRAVGLVRAVRRV